MPAEERKIMTYQHPLVMPPGQPWAAAGLAPPQQRPAARHGTDPGGSGWNDPTRYSPMVVPGHAPRHAEPVAPHHPPERTRRSAEPTTPATGSTAASEQGYQPFWRRQRAAEPERQPLADDFFRLIHDDRTGNPHMSGPVAHAGMAAALLAELIHTRILTVHQGVLVAGVGGGRRGPDDLGRQVLEAVIEQEPRPVDTWLSYLHEFAYPAVTSRLVLAGHLGVPEGRRRGDPAYRPVNRNAWYGVQVRIGTSLSRGLQMHEVDTILTGLAGATRVLGVVAYDGGQPRIPALIRQLDPTVRHLLEVTTSAVTTLIAKPDVAW
jgi:hypothetical protein